MKRIVMMIACLVGLSTVAIAQNQNQTDIEETLYSNLTTWKQIESHLPEGFRTSPSTMPEESFTDWNGWKIHLDSYKNEDAPAKVILLHGVGGNGRLLSFIAVPLFNAGYEVIAPDLPGYGNSIVQKRKVVYEDWVNLVSFLIDQEKAKDQRPVFVFGLSAGGMLAYHAAAKNPQVAGVIATNLLDQRDKRVRDASTGSKLKSRVLVPMLKFTSLFAGGAMLPMKKVANMKAIVNDEEVLKLLLNDEKSSGTKVPLRFLTSLIKAKPAVEPEDFQIPVLLVHPGDDLWTPTWTSEVFFNRLSGKKELKILENAGHFPIEQPGISQLPEYAIRFLRFR
ncbi:Lysophospholipase, alpha-beta hydrolase superfamily [Cyclobacterium xiamenense]|uniref:Lysophospholipase, alpha-beta hydrolase superfamily n=1 Tax=Cyclobacterium xiamenense TaxID=1297121 RepID=A0A1H7ADE4_9BACT|nr:alpha/beta hydrolase [Cyclobacterium xiamenense]SEJ62956.1 Lysophospholipase, alpha-beta hydrolase superfamily [Cyclobacterium xiamenense]